MSNRALARRARKTLARLTSENPKKRFKGISDIIMCNAQAHARRQRERKGSKRRSGYIIFYPDPVYNEHLRRSLADSDPDVRAAAAVGLAQVDIAALQSVPASEMLTADLLRLLEKGGCYGRRRSLSAPMILCDWKCYFAIGAIGHEDGIWFLRDILAPEKAAAVEVLENLGGLSTTRSRVYAAIALGISGQEEVFGYLQSTAAVASREVCRACAYALGFLKGSPQAIPYLGSLLETASDRGTRMAAAYSLARLGPESVPRLIECLRITDVDVVFFACLALTAIGTSSCWEAVGDVAQSDDERLRKIAQDCIEEWDSKEAEELRGTIRPSSWEKAMLSTRDHLTDLGI